MTLSIGDNARGWDDAIVLNSFKEEGRGIDIIFL
jgi:hypothetical protein